MNKKKKNMLQSYDPYYRVVPNILGENTKKELLEIALKPNAFVDISYKISFFKLPSTIQKFNNTGLNCVCQLLKVNESGSKIHKDKNRYNEFEGTYIQRQTVVSFPLTENCGETWFYDESLNKVASINYEGYGAILNTGGHYHNVYFTEDNDTRIVFQLCFEEAYEDVCQIFEDKLKGITL